MLNISNNTIIDKIDPTQFKSFGKNDIHPFNLTMKRWLLVMLALLLVVLFLPWTQNIQTRGKVTTLLPDQRPQTIHSTIPGRVEHWYVREGELVRKGDTIVHLSEVKTEYFDPQLVQRAASQVSAMQGSIQAYGEKVEALENQITAMQNTLEAKTDQLENKLLQTQLKVQSDSIDLLRAVIDLEIAQRQFDRVRNLYEKGLKSLTDVEDKNLKLQEASAKRVSVENIWLSARNDLQIVRLELLSVKNEYADKIAKAQSDKFSTLSARYDAEGKLQQLQVDRENYRQRAGFHFITAPQDCYITQATVSGIGETVKEGDQIVSIMPAGADLAVEMYVQPIDLPLVRLGNQVNFIFDGWPAFVFSGWPGLTYGTYQGKVVAIDNNIGSNGAFRILVAPDTKAKAWPDALRPGGGAQAIALLNDVPVWYEVWRQLNGFPPDYYARGNGEPSETGKSS
ncbi:MAG: hypothetical protein RLY31_2266 [Bacteroidota bacterium]|jgi:multidrug resistance efflux pump